MHPLMFVLLAVLIFLLGSGGYVFWIACRRRKELPWLVEEEIGKTGYGKYYSYIQYADRWLSNHRVEDVWIESSDGLKLYGRWIPAPNPKGTVILAHGYRSTVLADFAMIFAYYHSLGLNMLVPDQRSHGHSEGKYITFGVKESGDMLRWLEYHNRHYGQYPVILSGLSMGASTMLFLADAKLPENVKGFVADCGFTSPWAIISKVFSGTTHMPAGPTLVVADLFARLFAGFHLKQKDTVRSLSAATRPVLLVHGAADSFVPHQMSQSAYASCCAPKQLMLVEGAEHGVSYLSDPENYKKTLLAFLSTVMEGFGELRGNQEL